MPVISRQPSDISRQMSVVKQAGGKRRGYWLLTTDYWLLLTGYCLLFTAYSSLLTACSSTPPVVKIGLVAPFEGREREIGYDVIYSARLAVREINEAGGISGTYVALVALDDGGNVTFAEATAQSLIVDPAVVAVLGHWLPETTTAAAPLYHAAALPFVTPDSPVAPDTLPDDFRQRYEAVTPFDETPGPYAGPAYAAIQTIFAAIAAAQSHDQPITRENVAHYLNETTD